MKKIFIIVMLICSGIFVTGCGENKEINQNNTTTSEMTQEDDSKAAQNNSNKQDSNTEATNSQSNAPNKTTNDSTMNSTSKDEKAANKINKKDYYTNKLNNIQTKIDKDYDFQKAMTTADMRSVTGAQYKLWDDALNEIYKDLQNALPSGEKIKLKEEELSWISKKETNAQNEADKVKGGTLEPVYYGLSAVDSTKNRCYELVNKYME